MTSKLIAKKSSVTERTNKFYSLPNPSITRQFRYPFRTSSPGGHFHCKCHKCAQLQPHQNDHPLILRSGAKLKFMPFKIKHSSTPRAAKSAVKSQPEFGSLFMAKTCSQVWRTTLGYSHAAEKLVVYSSSGGISPF